MSSTAPTKQAHSTNTLPSGKGVFDWVKPFLTSTVGMKVTTAITGTALTFFVIGHLVGNLKILDGRDSLNAYAHFLKSLGPWLWVARGGLLAAFALHIVLALYLKKRSVDARPVKYAYPKTIQASFASRTMPWTGSVILLFVLFHLAHYTLGYISTTEARHEVTKKIVQVNYLDLIDDKGRHDVYSMVVAGFNNPVVCGIYIAAMIFLVLHLSHGISSVFQTLGLNTPRVQPFVKRMSWGLALLIGLGNIGIVVTVKAGLLGDSYVPWTKVGDVIPAPDLTTPVPPAGKAGPIMKNN